MNKSGYSGDQTHGGFSRRDFLKRMSWLGLAGASAPLLTGRLRAAGTPSIGGNPIQHVLICCNENRSFDHYYGYAPFAGAFGVPAGYTQPDGSGGFVSPQLLTSPNSKDPMHDWDPIHSEWDNGKMDGFFTTNGAAALGYYNQNELPFYYALFNQFTLCGHYFCSLLGGTFPNRLYLVGGTSGGNTTNSITAGSLTYPIILDLLDAAGINWKVYHIGEACTIGGQGSLNCDNVFQLFQKWRHDPRVNHFSQSDYNSDLKSGRLPQVSFLMTKDSNAEHPPFSVKIGQLVQLELIGALVNSRYWSSSAYFLTYDEAGGFFDHVVPPALDAYGAGIRVPTWVISPFAKKSHIEPTIYEHGSILKFVEAVFGLPTLASVNHQFDLQTPGTNNQAANGQPFGPPAPPRDGRTDIGNMMECFSF